MNLFTKIAFGLLTIILAALAIDPAELGPRLAAYGTLLATAASYLLWPFIIGLGLFVFWLVGRTTRLTGRRVRLALDRYIDTRVNEGIAAYKRDVSNIDPTPMVEYLVRNPKHLETLGGHLGIGKPSTAADSVIVRISQLEARVFHLIDQSERYDKMGELVADLALNRATDGIQFRKIMDLNQRYFAARMRYPDLRDGLRLIWEQWDWSERTWAEWAQASEDWQQDLQRWLTLFPEMPQFNDLQSVLEVNAVDIREAIQDWKRRSVLTDEQEHDYRTFAAIRLKFARTGWHAVLMLGELVQAPKDF